MQQVEFYQSVKGVPVKKPVVKNYRERVLWLIFSLSVFRLVLAFVLQLGNDEAYYWLYSQHVKANYFDHPPMVAFWIRVFTANLLLQDQEVFLRLGSIVSCAAATWFLYKAVALIHTSKAGWLAAVLYNASFYAGLTAGLYIMPDSPQMVFWTLSLWAIAKVVMEEMAWRNWLLLGAAAGLCIMSKIHGAFIPLGVGLYALLHRRNWLKKPQPYVALLVTAIIASPILFWNIEYDFITYQFHSNRVTIEEPSVNLLSFFRELLSQVFFNNPVNTGLILLALLAWKKQGLKRWQALRVYNYIGLPFATALLVISLFRDTTLPHWSGPAYVSFLPMAAISLARRNMTVAFPAAAKWSLGLFVGVLLTWTATVHFYPGTFGSQQRATLGKNDISLDVYGWEEASEAFYALYKDDLKTGRMPHSAPIVCTYWWGAHIEYYFCRPHNIKMLGMGSIRDLREYWWMNDSRKGSVNVDQAYCIMPVDDDYAIPASFYDRVELAKEIQIDRSGRPAHIFKIYRLKGWKGTLQTAQVVNVSK